MDGLIDTLHYDGARGGVVINDTHFVLCKDIESFIDALCTAKGSSIDGRRKAFTKITGQVRKVPVYVQDGLILVPDGAARDIDTVWYSWPENEKRLPELTCLNIRQFLRAIDLPLEKTWSGFVK